MEDSKSINCTICCELVSIENMFTLSICGCSFCKKCVLKYIFSIFYDQIDTSCTCPSHKCKVNGYFTDLELIVPNLEIEHSLVLTYCPAPGCDSLCKIPASDYDTFQSKNTIYFSNKQGKSTFKRLTCWYRKRMDSLDKHSKQFKGNTFDVRSAKQDKNNLLSYEKEVKFVNDITINRPQNLINGSTNIMVNSTDLVGPNLNPELRDRLSFPSSNAIAKPTSLNFSKPVKPIVCSQCAYEFCARCHLPWHQGNRPFICESTKHRKYFKRKKSINPINLDIGPHDPNPNKTNGDLNKDNDPTSSTPLNSLKMESKHGKMNFSCCKLKKNNRLSKKSMSLNTTNNGVNPSLSSSVTTTVNSCAFDKKKLTMSNSTAKVDLSLFAVGFPPYSPDDWLKRCPACLVPIERIEGCAQMICRSCKHTFCWYCLTSLDDDFLLQHYDDGDCKGKLGHSRASVIGHRVYVVSIFTALTVLLLVAAPFIMVAVPCIICAKCHRVYHQHQLRKRHSKGLYLQNGCLISSNSNPNTSQSNNLSNSKSNLTLQQMECPNHPDDLLVQQQQEKADIHWLPPSWKPDLLEESNDMCEESNAFSENQIVVHRSISVSDGCLNLPDPNENK